MTKYGGYMGKVLIIDVKNKTTSLYPWSDGEREDYLGGKIMAAKIIKDNVGSNVQAFDEENILVISTGPLTGTNAPASSRFNISTISPLTGLLTSSNCGGNFGIHLKRAGYDALIIKNKSESPIWIEITEDEVLFHDAKDLWGKMVGQTQEALDRKAGKVVIGPAGENLIKYASIFSGERTAGRGGIGAVMGDKNIKAITAKGNLKPKINNVEGTKEFYKKWIELLKNHPLTGEQLPTFGTAGLISLMQHRNVLTTKNFKYGNYHDFDKISGERLRKDFLVRNRGCITCPIQCGRQVEVDGRIVKGPELETLALLGSNLLNNDLQLILRWNLELDELGMDTISTGGTIAFAMELNEKGLWKNGLEFGKTGNLSNVFKDIAYRRGIGNELAEGTRYLSNKYGGAEFAMHSKGMELSAYEPRSAVGQGLGYAVSNRGGCHLNAGYLVLFEGLGLSIDPYTTKSKAELTVLTQNLMEAISSAGNCLFTLYSMLPKYLVKNPNSRITRLTNRFLTTSLSANIIKFVNKADKRLLPIKYPSIPQIKAIELVTGMKMSLGKLLDIGDRGYNLERIYNVERGIRSKDDSLPDRLTKVKQKEDETNSYVPLDELKERYYRIRGWDQDGIPTRSKLKKLKLIE
ncbi:aldehyde ferredoxin oxidoreductase family protein [Tepidimicrobium xylanilyticum]|uniref:aldehyde ferredoxin oxidoreductase family protein n=1 Tax=Tepidimicrobium xylanilyticum TaxID=1123352 RepID=UPI00264BB7F1|nr:aldehyde ferredoxin oxidoreductase family protein [Tepidimicrobium xylanilyticum]GMG95474.1 aldehyde ferredoxin oxidoreductase [Tepidimicrobium xylanilyticum]